MKDLPRYWKPLTEISQQDFKPIRPELIKESMSFYNIDEAAARKMLEDEHARCRFFVNDIYQVALAPWDKDLMHINIRRRDGAAIFDWRHIQQIKNEVVGPECEAVQLFPAESRKVDTSNKYHLWAAPENKHFGIGWKERDVQYDPNRDVPGMRQRPL